LIQGEMKIKTSSAICFSSIDLPAVFENDSDSISRQVAHLTRPE